MDTGPIDRKGWPKARTEFPSTQVTVPVAERSMSPDRSCVATAEPGWRGEGAIAGPGVPAALPDGTLIQLAASAIREKSGPGASLPPKETGIGRADIESAEEPAVKDLTSSSSLPVNLPVLKAETNDAVEAEEPEIG